MMNSFNNYSWWNHPALLGFGAMGITVISILLIVVIALKGYALWFAAKRDEKWWFVALLVLNTMGILELVYIIFIAKKWNLVEKSGSMSANDSGNPNNNGPKTN